MPNLDTLPAGIQVQIVSLCDLSTKSWRLTCRTLFSAARVLPLGQVYLVARDKTLATAQAIINEVNYRKRATGIVIDILMYNINNLGNHDLLHEMYLAKQDLRKPGFNEWNLSWAKAEYSRLYHKQEQCIRHRQGARFRAVLTNALIELENVETITITDQFSRWYYNDGPLSREMKFAPFTTYSTPYTLGRFTLMLMTHLWETRETRHPKTKSFVAEIFGDPKGLSEVGDLPYDAIYWGVSSILKNDDSVFRGVFKGFERLSVDMSLLRHFNGFGQHVKTLARAVKPAQIREEWIGIGKMMAGAENLLSLDLRFRDGILHQVPFEVMLSNQRWINLTSLRLLNVHASADNLAGFLEGHTNLKTLALIRVAISGDLLMNGIVGPLAYPIDDLLVWGDLAARVAAVLTLESVALFCLREEGLSLSESIWTCGRTPFCRHVDVEEAFLSGRPNQWNHQLRPETTFCGQWDSD